MIHGAEYIETSCNLEVPFNGLAEKSVGAGLLCEHAVHKPQPVLLALARDPALAAEIARRILNAHFPESIRQDVADAVGLDLDAFASSLAATIAPTRSPLTLSLSAMRGEETHTRCRVCGHELRMGGHAIGLEAARIEWFQARRRPTSIRCSTGEDTLNLFSRICSKNQRWWMFLKRS